MADKYQPITDDMFLSDDESDPDGVEDEDKQLVEKDPDMEEGEVRMEAKKQKMVMKDNEYGQDHTGEVLCQLCNQKFTWDSLRLHLLDEHTQKKIIKCSLCDQKFATKHALKDHLMQMHLGETTSCHICNKKFKDLYHHVKYSHDDIKNYECSYCHNEFVSKTIMHKHVQSVHLGEKTNCPKCKKDISTDNFRRHLKEIHDKIKTPCKQCGRKFSPSLLQRHYLQVHTNYKHKCPECGKKIAMSNLSKHVKSVHRKIKLTCEFCNIELPYGSMPKHKRTEHNIEMLFEPIS